VVSRDVFQLFLRRYYSYVINEFHVDVFKCKK